MRTDFNNLSKIKRAVFEFMRRGGKILECGTVIGISGKIIKPYPKSVAKRRGGIYMLLTVKLEDRCVSIGLHQIQAATKFGFEKFANAECVRHMDGDSLNNSFSNIEIGTIRENHFDMSEVQRIKRSENAATTRREKDKKMWEKINIDRNNGMTYPQLSEKYGVCKSSLSYNLSKSAKKVSKMHGVNGQQFKAVSVLGEFY